MREKLVKRLHVSTMTSNAAWALESQILTVTTHALGDAVVGYGPAATGARLSIQGMRKIDTTIRNRAARRINGTNITMRVESMMLLADIQSTYNHYILKSAPILDRILRASGAAAQRTARTSTMGRAQEAKFEW